MLLLKVVLFMNDNPDLPKLHTLKLGGYSFYFGYESEDCEEHREICNKQHSLVMRSFCS